MQCCFKSKRLYTDIYWASDELFNTGEIEIIYIFNKMSTNDYRSNYN